MTLNTTVPRIKMIYCNGCNNSEGGLRVRMIVMPNCLKGKQLPLNVLLISNYLSTGHVNPYC